MLPKILSNLSLIFPIPAFYANFVLQEGVKTIPPDLSAQGWIITAVVAGMGLTKIALWVRGNGKSNGNGSSSNGIPLQISNLDKILSNLSTTVSTVVRNQDKLTELGARAMENHIKLSVSMENISEALEHQNRLLEKILEEARDARN